MLPAGLGPIHPKGWVGIFYREQSVKYEPIEFSKTDDPGSLVVKFRSFEHYNVLARNDKVHDKYLTALFLNMVGMTMPFRVTLIVPVDSTLMTPEEFQAVTKLGAKNGLLVLGTVISHPELNKYPLEKEFLPMLVNNSMRTDSARRISRLVAAGLLEREDKKG